MKGILKLSLWLVLFGSSFLAQGSTTDPEDESELVKYLKEVKFDAEEHRAKMRKEISLNLCPELRASVKKVRDKEQ